MNRMMRMNGTKNTKCNKRMRIFNIVTAIILVSAMWLAFPAEAAAQAGGSKEENVYVSLESNGTFLNAYIVNAFTLEKPGIIEDYGAYDTVRNLSTTDELAAADGQIRVNAPAGRFYYQGNLSKAELPWLISVTYTLDGKETSAQDLSGAEGMLKIKIGIRKNGKAVSGFAEHYAVQTTVTLDADLCRDIEAEGAAIANAGSNKVITFSMLPGSEADYTISADVKDFHMNGIQFSAVPFSMDISSLNTDDVTGKLSGISQLAEGIAELDKGAQGLNSGAAELKDGASQLNSGMHRLQPGLKQANDGLKALTEQNPALQSGSAEILNGLTAVTQGIPDSMAELKGALTALTKSFEQLQKGIVAYTNGTAEIAKGTEAITSGYTGLVQGSDALTSGISELHKGTQQLSAGTGQLKKGTSNLDREMKSVMDELIESFTGGVYEPVSFISPKNTDIKSVQFVMQTKGVEEKHVEKTVTETKAKLSFWQRLLALFGL